ncbi:hypothetical protein CTAYLR_008207 [Chrysophaeum taylorii]|uniref:Phosphoribosylanthranilate isomerase n=1 Tax=Chrysophaeum taylorii TaxID=2483200 RepID=A0AAD7UBY6_9STRA|nr:hypothetical protein CTAYLR_008207 [Chrysophaeum taylorii]
MLALLLSKAAAWMTIPFSVVGSGPRGLVVRRSEESGHLLGFGNESHVPSTLQKIAARRLELAIRAPEPPSRQFDRIDVFEKLKRPPLAIAAEFKRASPSKGPIALEADVAEVAREYAAAGAALISVLTEPEWFRGSLDDMLAARRAVEGPDRPAILRKDFISVDIQIREAASFGADAALLIVACLGRSQLKSLVATCFDLGIEPLVEVHTREEMEVALESGARCFGINNRNLHTFELDMETTSRLAPMVPKEAVVASLSGVSTSSDLAENVDCVLVGESLMRATDKRRAVEELLSRSSTGGSSRRVATKVCGLTTPQDALEAARAGADLLGVVFAPASKRRVDSVKAREIVDTVRAFGERRRAWHPPEHDALRDRARALVEARGPLVVGVFQDQPLDEVLTLVAAAGVDLVQLHGQESAEYAAKLGPHIRVVHATQPYDRAACDLPNCVAVLVDSVDARGNRGGSGLSCDLDLVRDISADLETPVFLAGGIDADKLQDLPFVIGFDASSKLEISPGIKDLDKVHAFVKKAKTLVSSSSHLMLL